MRLRAVRLGAAALDDRACDGSLYWQTANADVSTTMKPIFTSNLNALKTTTGLTWGEPQCDKIAFFPLLDQRVNDILYGPIKKHVSLKPFSPVAPASPLQQAISTTETYLNYNWALKGMVRRGRSPKKTGFAHDTTCTLNIRGHRVHWPGYYNVLHFDTPMPSSPIEC